MGNLRIYGSIFVEEALQQFVLPKFQCLLQTPALKAKSCLLNVCLWNLSFNSTGNSQLPWPREGIPNCKTTAIFLEDIQSDSYSYSLLNIQYFPEELQVQRLGSYTWNTVFIA